MGDSTLGLLQGTVDLLILRALQPAPAHGNAVSRMVRERAEGEILPTDSDRTPAGACRDFPVEAVRRGGFQGHRTGVDRFQTATTPRTSVRVRPRERPPYAKAPAMSRRSALREGGSVGLVK